METNYNVNLEIEKMSVKNIIKLIQIDIYYLIF
uniref:Uncharacterized protein n=1 Tax=viral metagenome TaxID=1070528 RepID=A0A6C0AEG8_9ZZZZ